MSSSSITVTAKNRFFKQLVTAQASTAAYLVSHVMYGGLDAQKCVLDNPITQVCFAKKIEIDFSAGSLFHFLVTKGDWPHSIELTLRSSLGPPPPSESLNAVQLVMGSVYEQAFLSYFENILTSVVQKYGHVANCPPVLAFGRILRNAFAHGGVVIIQDGKTASWGNITYSQMNNGRRVMYNDLSSGDLTLLMVEMDQQI